MLKFVSSLYKIAYILLFNTFSELNLAIQNTNDTFHLPFMT